MKKFLVLLILLVGTLTSFGRNEFDDGGTGITVNIIIIVFGIINLVFLVKGIQFFNRYLELNSPFLYDKNIQFFNRYLELNPPFLYYKGYDEKNDVFKLIECDKELITSGDYYVKFNQNKGVCIASRKGYEDALLKEFDTKNEAFDYIKNYAEKNK